jgi:hypothetical protein
VPHFFSGTVHIAIPESPNWIGSLLPVARAQSFTDSHTRAVPESLSASGTPHTQPRALSGAQPGALSGAQPGALSGAQPGTDASTRTFPDQGSRRTAARPLA